MHSWIFPVLWNCNEYTSVHLCIKILYIYGITKWTVQTDFGKEESPLGYKLIL